jgi:phospholipid N-methyltransferase
VSKWIQKLRFLGAFLRRPFTTGAVAPSSAHLAREIVSHIGLEKAKVVAEFGAGTGVFTREILKRVSPEARVLVFEINPSMASMLKKNVPGADVIVDSVQKLPVHLAQRELKEVDCIVCGLPWAVFSEELQNSILSAMAKHMAPDGRFATFAYVHAAWFPSARKLRKKLETHFCRIESSPVVWRNFPPAFIWRCADAPSSSPS